MAASAEGRVLKRANPNTIQDKFLVGYQGWFTCAGDGPPVHNGHHGWLHWFNKPIPDGGKPTVDLWPDVSSYTPSELFPAPALSLSDGSPALLFSSRHPLTVQRHFHWMAQHRVDGVFLQRFAGQCEVDGRTEGSTADIMRLRDEVLDRVREAAEMKGRVWAIMYDVSGVPAERIEKVIKVDWAHLVRDKHVSDSPYYLKEEGRPVIALWGFGFAGRGHTPSIVRSIVRHLRATTPGGAYIMAGAPTHWQTLRGDADPNPEFLSVWYNEFDAISPWTVGRFGDEEAADRFAKEKIKKDLDALRDNSRRTVDYIPVVFPGGSGFNLSYGKWALNEQPRDGGRFLWRQLYNINKVARSRIVYGAMWDEYDEGTAFLPVVSKKRELPVQGTFLALDADGYDLPPDWYMRIAGFAGEVLRGEREMHETFPVKDLQDYWSSRPHYEPLPQPAPLDSAANLPSPDANGSGSGSADAAQTFEEWCAQEKAAMEDAPPPPYTFEADEPAAAASSSSVQGQAQNQSQVRQEQSQLYQPQPPGVPVQTRPASLPAANGRENSLERPPVPPSATRPASSDVATWNGGQDQGRPFHGPPVPPLAHRPTSLPSAASSSSSAGPSVPYQVYTPRPAGRRPSESGTGPAPGEIFHHPVHNNFPHPNDPGPGLPHRPNWSTHPQMPLQQQQQQLSPYPPNGGLGLRPSVSASGMNERFGRQRLDDGMEQVQGMHSSYVPQTHRPPPPPQRHSSSSAGTPISQWPPPEWGVQPQPQTCPTPHPSTLSPPVQHSSTRPRPSLSPGFGRTSSTSPRPPPSPSAGNVYADSGSGMGSPGWDAFQQPQPQANTMYNQVPYAQQMMPPSPSSGPSVSTYPNTYPDTAQGYMMPSPTGGRGYGQHEYADNGAAGGFYPAQPRPNPHSYPQQSSSSFVPSSAQGFNMPPHVPPRHPQIMSSSISPGQIMPSPSPSATPTPTTTAQYGYRPGGLIPGTGRLTNAASDTYTRTLGAVDKLLTGTSSAGSKVYQRFRG